MALLALPALLALVASSGCKPVNDGPHASGYCYEDRDCLSPATCTRAQVCSASPVGITLRWRIDGVIPTLTAPGACAELGDLRVEFGFGSAASALVYAPVPCEAGQFRLDKAPLELFEQVSLQQASGAGALAIARRADLVAREVDGGIEGDELIVTLTLR